MQIELTITTVPGGLTAQGGALLSALVSPRLDTGGGDATLAHFGPLLEDWPSTLAGLTWQVEHDGGAADAIVASTPDSALWQAVFPPSTPVRSAQRGGYTDHHVLSYPAAEVGQFLTDTLLETALLGEAMPALADLTAEAQPLSQVAAYGRRDGNRLAGLFDQLESLRGRPDPASGGLPARAIAPGPSDPVMDMARVSEVFAPPTYPQTGRPPLAAPAMDFHRVLTALAVHPSVLRRLGLLVDLHSDDVLALQGATKVRAVPSPLPESIVPRLPYTAVHGGSFRPRPRDAETAPSGVLPLDDPAQYRILTFDAGGAALRYRDFATNLMHSTRQGSPSTPDHEALPALRSTGLQLVRRGAATALVKRMDRMAQLAVLLSNPDADELLYEEDLRRGFRVDVREVGSGEWRSLHLRNTTADVPGYGLVELAGEEGTVTTAASRKPLETENGIARLYLSETVAHWQGWSLSAAQPGTPLHPEADGLADAQTDLSQPDPSFPVRISHAVVPGSLPALRFGKTYELRARTVDLAGGGLAPDDRTESQVSPPTPYLRWEPVGTPAILPQAVRDEGGSLTRVVLRSDFDQGPGEPPPVPAEADFTYPIDSQRWLAAPKVGPDLAEAQGVLDDPAGGFRADAYQILASRADADFDDVPGTERDPANYYRAYYPGPDAGLPPLPVPWLPDPLAAGLAIRGIPGHDGPLLVPFRTDHAWPVTWPVRLLLRDVDGQEVVVGSADGQGERVVTFGLPKAARMTLQVSCAFPDAGFTRDLVGLDLMAVWQGMAERDREVLERREGAETGGFWALTPHTTLDLVHAVRRPLKAPGFTRPMAVQRAAGSTVAQVSTVLDFHRDSTGRLDLHARWVEGEDLGTGQGAPAPPPTPLTSSDGSGTTRRTDLQVPIPPLTEGQPDQLVFEHDFGDTRARMALYEPEATTAFAEYFTSRRQVQLHGTTPVRVAPRFLPDSDTLHSVPPAPAVGASPELPADRFARGRDYIADPSAGTVARTEDSAITDGQMVDVEYLEPPVTRVGGLGAAEIPASTRPPQPVVLGVLPAFRWRRPTALSSRRTGNLVRIWLDRPWFASGIGERLGVVCARTAQAAQDSQALVSRWGFDPVTADPGPMAAAPLASAFPGAVDVLPGVQPPTGAPVDVAVHDVTFSTERQLWYCDVAVAPGSAAYWPFVRLVVARVQANALTSPVDLRISGLVVTDQVQVAPDRATLVQRLSGDRVRVTVSGSSLDGGPTTTVRAFVEQRPRSAPADDPASWTPGPGRSARTVLTPPVNGANFRAGDLRAAANAIRFASRVVVEEVEVHPTGNAFGQTTQERVVYTDTIDL